jgi:hypothetical protein
MTSDDRTLEVLGDEIAELSAHIQAATCRWLGLVAEFDAREGWAALGCRSCVEWLAYRCSLSPTAARDHVRVARRLRELPLVRAAFSRGELSYSKVRALTRIEDVDREQELVELTQYMTAAQLERTVRGYRQVLNIEAAQVHDDRFVSISHADDGSVSLRGRLSREEGAVLQRALELMRDAGASAESPEGEPVSAGARNADALVAIADAALAAPMEGRERVQGDRFQVVVHVDTETLRSDDGGGRCELDDHAPLATETARRLCCDGSLVPLLESAGEPLSVGRKTRAIPPALRRALRSRDGGCQFPGCNQRRRVDAHHIQHWARGGATELSNLVELCRHHHRLVHEGGFGLSGVPGRLTFHRPDGRVLPAVPRSRGDCQVPTRIARVLNPAIDGNVACRLQGDPLNLDGAVQAFLAYAPVPDRRATREAVAVET